MNRQILLHTFPIIHPKGSFTTINLDEIQRVWNGLFRPMFDEQDVISITMESYIDVLVIDDPYANTVTVTVQLDHYAGVTHMQILNEDWRRCNYHYGHEKLELTSEDFDYTDAVVGVFEQLNLRPDRWIAWSNHYK